MELRSRLEPLARHQGLLVTRAQALSLGVTDAQLRTAARTGVLLRRQRSVYALPDDPPPAQDLRAVAARLKSVVSHDSAAMWWGFPLGHQPVGWHLTVPRGRGRRSDSVRGVVLHRRDLADCDVVRRDGLFVTTVVQTILDCARTLALGPAVAVADSALRTGRLQRGDLIEAARRLPRGPGRRNAVRVADLSHAQSGSVLESLTRVLLCTSGLAPPHVQYPFLDRWGRWVGDVDFAWDSSRLLLETDGFAFHRERADYRNDRRRANAFAREAWWLLRLTWEDVVGSPEEVVRLVRDTMDALPGSRSDLHSCTHPGQPAGRHARRPARRLSQRTGCVQEWWGSQRVTGNGELTDN